jgi:hypothetical protein
MSQIKLVTFKTQQTIICNLEYTDDYNLKVKNPIQVISVPPRTANDSGGVGFAPYLSYSEEFDTGIILKQEDVFCVTTPVIDLINQYNKMFGSGIEIAPAGLRL